MVRCSKCDAVGAKTLCSRCQAAYYCDTKCQHEHWNQKVHGHKDICRECRDAGGVFFEGLQKNSILDLAQGKGGSIARSQGYPVLTALALALKVPRLRFVSAVRHARGDLDAKWESSLSFEERVELKAPAPDEETTDYVSFTSPLSRKRRKISETTPERPHVRRAVDATPISGQILFTDKRTRKPSKRYIDEGDSQTSSKPAPRRELKRKSNSSDKSDHLSSNGSEDDDDLEYTDLAELELSYHDRQLYWDKVGATFEDTDCGIRFKVLSVCISTEPALGLFYRYRDAEDSDDEYTPCSEMVKASWVNWIAESSGSSKS